MSTRIVQGGEDAALVSLPHASSAKTPCFSVNVGATSTTVLAANADRVSALIVNYSDTLIWLALGPVAEAAKGIPLAPMADGDPGGSYEITAANAYTGIVTAIHAGEGDKVLVGVEV